MDKPVYWSSDIPLVDNFGKTIIDEFIDGATQMGKWAIMTKLSFHRYGVGLGTGKGQRYMRQADGRFKKVEG